MKKKNGKRLDRFTVFLLLICGFMCINLAAVAIILPTLRKSRVNEFSPASAGIAIIENDGDPKQTLQNELVFTAAENGAYRTDKKVQVTNLGNDEYIKVCLVPQWYDSEGRLCGGLGELSDFGNAEAPDPETNTQKHTGSSDGSFVILTYELAPDWDDYWTYDGDTGTYFYKTPLRKGETTQPLITGVEIPQEIYSRSEGLELRIDVLTESIQTTAGAERIRALF